MPGFFERWFKPTKVAQSELVSIEQAATLLETSQIEQLNQFRKEQENRLREIQTLLDEIFEDLKPLEGKNFVNESQNQFIGKVVQTSNGQFVHRMKQLIQKLDVPFTKKNEDLLLYAQTAHQTLALELADFYKSVLYAGILAKAEMKTVGQKMERLENELRSLRDSAAKVVPSAANGAKEALIQLEKLMIKEKEINNELKDFEQELVKGKKELELNQQEINRIQLSDDFKESHQNELKKIELEKKKTALKQKPREWMLLVEKELEKVVKSPTSNLNASEKTQVNQWVSNPENAFQGDPKGEAFKELLKKAIDGFQLGVVSFKSEKEKQKTIKVFEQLIQINFFDDYFWSINEMDRELKVVQSFSNAQELVQKLKLLESRQSELSQNVTKIEPMVTALRQRLEKNKIEQDSVLETLSLALSATVGKSITVQKKLTTASV